MRAVLFSGIKSRIATVISLILAIAAGIIISVDIVAEGVQSEPDLNVTVSQFSPDGSTPRETNITVHFSRHMVPADSLDKVVLESPLEFDPPLPGLARWIDKNVLRFYPDKGLAPATHYKVRVTSEKTYLYGNKINDSREFTFYTPPLKVVKVSGYPVFDSRAPGMVRLAIDLNFNYDIDLDKIRDKLSIVGGTNAVRAGLSYEIADYTSSLTKACPDSVKVWYAYALHLLTEEFDISTEKQEYWIKIGDGLPCYFCGEGLADDFHRAIEVRAQRRQFITFASARIAGKQGYIEINTNIGVSADDVEDYISIDPEVDFTIESYRYRINLRGDFKPGETYEVTVARGMPGEDGSLLDKEFSSRVTIPNMSPTITFSSRGIYLPRDGSKLIELETINVKKLSFEIDQVFANNLVYAIGSGYASDRYGSRNLDLVGRRFFSRTKELSGDLNEPLPTTIDVGEIIGDTAKGIFKIYARNFESRWQNDSRVVMLTDIGILARMADDYLMVWVNSLSDTRPLNKAMVTLRSKNNQVLARDETDSRGIVLLGDFMDRAKDLTPFLITVEYEDDLAYLKFSDCLLPISDFDVKGRPFLASGYESFLYLDRGVFRPGDTAHIVSIVRGVDGTTPPEFPYFITISDPAGRKFKSFRVKTSGESVLNLDVDIPDFARTGKYTLTAHIGEDLQIGRTQFQVEEFMPDRIKVTVATDKGTYVAGGGIHADVTGMFFFGPPAKGHRVTGHITIEEQDFSPSGWSSYSFVHQDRKFARLETDLGDTILDHNGEFTYTYQIPETLNPASALKGLVSAGVSEHGGRAVNAYAEVMIHAYRRYIGLKLDFEGYAKPGQSCEASLIAVNKEGTAVGPDTVDVNFYRLVYHTTLKKDSEGRYRYISERKPLLIESKPVTVPITGGKVSFTPPEYGRYMIVAEDRNGGHAASTMFFASGWGYAPWSMEEPDRIDIDLDKKEYVPGDNARIQIRAPFGGKLLLTVEKDKVIDLIASEMDGNTAEITIPVKRDFFPNAYITATVIKKAKDVDKSSPARAFGMVPLRLTIRPRMLELTITAPDVAKPKTEVSVIVDAGVSGAARLTLAAVDAGIHQLTDYQTPDPLDFFYGQRQPHLLPYDVYSFIYPEIQRAKSHMSSAGGRMFSEMRKRHLNPITARRVKSVALWSGIVTTDEYGKATIPLRLPEFNGKLNLVAVGVHGDRFGASSKEMIVRDKIVIQESFPRFVTPNDVVDGLVTIFNNTGKDAAITVNMSADGPAEFVSDASQSINLADNAEATVIFKFTSTLRPGKISFKIVATDGREHSELNFELPNRPGQPLVTEFGSGAVTETNPARFDLPGDWIERTNRTVIQTSSLSAVAYTKDINYLVGYPYGCLEQTTSRLFPLLYFNDLARFVQPELFGTGGPDYFIQEGIIKLTGMMQPSGWFSFWPGGRRINGWASIYASHFLLQARAEGFQIDNSLYKKIVEELKDVARGKWSKDKNVDVEEQIYAAYALTGSGIIEKKIINAVKKIYVDDLPAFSRYQIAGILAAAGEIEAAMELIPEGIAPAVFEPETGGRFSSGVRTNAILLDVLNGIDPEHPTCAVMAKSLMENARLGRWYTTQATAWALMALGKYLKGRPLPDYTGRLKIEGDSTYSFATDDFQLTRDNLAGNPVRIEIDGQGSCFYYWQSSGVPIDNAPREFTRGIKVSRTYQNVNGDPLDLRDIPIGTQVICHIKAEATDNHLQNVVINDLLPAAFEIENPRLKTTPRLSWLPKSSTDLEHQDIRDDRLLIFTDLQPRKPLSFFYSLRATAAGEFKIPPIAAECMYNPNISGASSSGVMIVRNNAP